MITVKEIREAIEKKLGYDYCEYAVSIECTNDGARGNAFEMSIKLALQNRRFKKVAKNGYFDTRKKNNDGVFMNLECKTGSGELWHIDRNGKPMNSNFQKSDYVVYCYRFDPLANLDDQEIFVVPSDVFLVELRENKLTRTKMTTYMKNCEIPNELKYDDVFSISADGASRAKKLDRVLMDMIADGRAMYLYEFLEDFFNIA